MGRETDLYHWIEGDPGVDAVVVYTDGMHSVRSPSFFEFFTGVSPVGTDNALLVSRSRDPTVVIDLPRDRERVRRHGTIRDVRANASFVDELQAALDDHGETNHLGLVGAGRMPLPVHRTIEAHGDRIESLDEEVRRQVQSKDAREIDIFRKLGAIADRGFEAAYEALRPGMKEYEVAAEIEYAMRSAGAEDNFNLLGSGRHNELMHSPTERIVEPNDLFLCELSPMYEGYVLQICRTIAVGTPTATVTDRYELLTTAMDRTKARLRAGIDASLISQTMNEVFREAGYGEYCQPPYMRTRGHEFGFGPIGMAITEGTDIELTEGMVLVIHPNQYVPETGYLALGDPVLIQEDDSETLTRTPPRLFTKEVMR